MADRFTRRELAAVLAVPALLAEEQQAPGTTNENRTLVQTQLKQNSEALAAFDVPIDVEPAVHFRP